MSLKPLLLALLLLLALSACSSFAASSTPTPAAPTLTPIPPSPTPPPWAASVNGEYITEAEFGAELERYTAAQAALGLTVDTGQAVQVVLEDLIAQRLLAQAARQAGFSLSEPDLQARLDSLADSLGGPDALSAWQSAHGYEDASFRLALQRSLEAAWMRDTILAAIPAQVEQVHLRQILAYKEADARAALDQLKTGADFDQLAARYDPLTAGELGWLPPGYLLDAQADQAVFALQVGAYSDIVQTPAGYHIFKVLERGDHPLSPDALLSVQQQTLRAWVAQQRAASQVELAQ